MARKARKAKVIYKGVEYSSENALKSELLRKLQERLDDQNSGTIYLQSQ